MNDYTRELVAAVIANGELIDAFLERTTSELFPVYYDLGSSDAYFQQEGNTLRSNAPQNTRVPKRDSLKENLMVLKADINRALDQLTLEDRITVMYYFTIYEGNNSSKIESSAMEVVDKIVELLNNGTNRTVV